MVQARVSLQAFCCYPSKMTLFKSVPKTRFWMRLHAAFVPLSSATFPLEVHLRYIMTLSQALRVKFVGLLHSLRLALSSFLSETLLLHSIDQVLQCNRAMQAQAP
eukprot:2318806-Amphidinium_carterae.1